MPLSHSDTHTFPHVSQSLSVSPVDFPPPLKLSRTAQAFGLIGQLSSVKSWIVDPPVGLVGLSITFGTNPDKSHMGLRETGTGVIVVRWQKPMTYPYLLSSPSYSHVFSTPLVATYKII